MNEDPQVKPVIEPPVPTDSASVKQGPVKQTAEEKMGCGIWALYLGLAAYIFVGTGIEQGLLWIFDQGLFDGSLPLPDLRWVFALVYALSVFLPGLLLTFTIKNPQMQGYFRLVTLAGWVALLTVPAHAAGVTDQRWAGYFLLLGLLLSVLSLAVLWRRKRKPGKSSSLGVGGAWIIGGLMGLPWLAWGAAGSIEDVLLALLAALGSGLVVALILEVSLGEWLYQERQVGRVYGVMNLLVDGLALALGLMVLATAIGVNGNQGSLVLTLTGLAWALMGLRVFGSGDYGRGNWLVIALATGLSAFWPLAMLDPDELALVVSMAAGERSQWVAQSNGVGLLLAVLSSIAVLVFVFMVPQNVQRKRGAWIGALAVTALGIAICLLFGKPGFYGERLFVVLNEQADLSPAAQIKNASERRAFVYKTLVETSNRSQGAIRSQLSRFGIPFTPYYLENAIEVQGGPLVRWWLARQPEVNRVLDSPVLRPLPAAMPASSGNAQKPASVLWNQKMIGADRVWTEFKVRGKGVVVGESDSGAQGDHPELADSYRGKNGQNDFNWLDPWNHSTSPVDIGGHGTHTLGTVLGKSVGIAPEAEWIGCVNLARNLGNPALYLDCMQFMLAPYPQNGDPLKDGDPARGANVLNNSWGCPPAEGCDAQTLEHAVSALRAAGVFVVASAGNDGETGCSSVKDPIALFDPVFSVGAVDEMGEIASFSSLGPVTVDGSNRLKPDIAAPGADVLSAFPNGTYAVNSGTSMAGPHVTGTVALIWSANPALIGDIERTEQILRQSARPYEGALPTCSNGVVANVSGAGILDAYTAVKLAMEKR